MLMNPCIPSCYTQAKQSLSEVENLYYRQNQGASSSAARSSSSTSPTGTNKQAPVTPSAAADPPINSRLFKDAALKRSEPDGGDVFGGYGLATPPASGGTQPSSYSLSSHATRRQSGSQTPVSPPGSAQPVESAAVKRSPSKGLGSNASSFNAKSGAATQQPQSASSLSGSRPAASGATSYADFWSRVGSSSATSKQGEREPAAATAASVPRRSSLVGAKRPADTSDDLASAGSEEAGGSPLKRVRMDLRESPAKNTPSLQERGSSFAARTREGNDGLPRLGRVGSPSPGARS